MTIRPALPGEECVRDPVSWPLRIVCLEPLGRALFAITGSIDAMRESFERVCALDIEHERKRRWILGCEWLGISDGKKQWDYYDDGDTAAVGEKKSDG
jgi:hypothetical protein